MEQELELFAKNLRYYREKQRLSAEEMADKLGVKPEEYVTYERDGAPAFPHLVEISQVLQLPICLLFSEADESETEEHWLEDLRHGLSDTRFRIMPANAENVFIINTEFLHLTPDTRPPKRIINKKHLYERYMKIPEQGLKGLVDWLTEYFLLTEALEYQKKSEG